MNWKTFKTVLIMTLLCFLTTARSQQPQHFILGQEELDGLAIYDIIQDHNQNYWLATDGGIVKFDGYSFKKLKCLQSNSSSFFDLKMNYDNIIHFKNFAGQIFQIKNDSCHLRFQIPDSLTHQTIDYSFTKKNELIIFTHSVLKVNEKNEIKVYNKHKSSYVEPFVLKDSSVIIHDYSTNNFITFKENKIDTTPIVNNNNCLVYFYYKNDTLCFLDKEKGLLSLENDTLSAKKNANLLLNQNILGYASEEASLWIANITGGVNIYDKNLNPLFNKTCLFKSNIISSFYKDKEGNMILGTFGDGLIVINDPAAIEINLPDPNDKITKITSTEDHLIFLGTKKGKIYKIDSINNISLFYNEDSRRIELLEYFSETNELILNGNGNYVIINLKTGFTDKKYINTIKDIKYVEKDQFLIATRSGLSFTNIKKLSNFSLKDKHYLPSFNERAKRIGYYPKTKTIYSGTPRGLKIGTTKKSFLYKLDNQPILCQDIIYFDEKIYIATKKNGILIFKGNQRIDHWTTDQLNIEQIKMMREYRGKIYILTDSDLQILNAQGKTITKLSTLEGVYPKKVLDFEINDNTIWLAYSRSVQPIQLKSIKTANFKPNIFIQNIFVNDSLINLAAKSVFNYSQNKFEFIIATKSLHFKNEIKYHYQLQGLNEKWQINDYSNNKIIYKSLPPGNYIFKVKTVLKDNESEILFYYFKIKQSLWDSWWFYLTLTLIFTGILYLVFRQQIKKHRRKTQLQNELNASKLIAIQSQMNPHFIFNAINSIQDLILQGDADNSYNFVIKFSKLVRQTLSFSDKEFIDIEDEIELLTNYLDLEKLRFKDDFEYKIEVSNIKNLRIPPMLIQPFVENALKHGLLHKEGIKKIDIEFQLNETLTCLITDNGIGREKALAIKNRQQYTHQSFSTSATEKRFKIMEAHYQKKLKISYIDLINDNKSSGTRVCISIPFKVNY